MIIYGTKAVHLKSAQLNTVACPNCGTQGSLTLSVFSKHAHAFWIPLFPIGKVGASQCQHCQHVLQNNQMTGEVKFAYDKFKNETSVPKWQFAGLALFACFIVWVIYANNEATKRKMEYLSAPVAGDVYEYKIDSARYSTMKVMRVSNDSVYAAPNEYEISKMKGIDKLDKPENYADFTYAISKDQIKKMYDSKDIFNIKRK